MSVQSIAQSFPIFTDIDGQPLENGNIYIGTAGLAAQTNQITVYWDASLSTPATQPIRTTGGYPMNSGSPGMLYTGADDYSLDVQNKNGTTVYSSLNVTGRIGDALIRFTQSGAGATERTLESKLQDSVSIKDFGAVGDNVADDSAALQAAINTGKAVYVPSGTYYCPTGATYTGSVSVYGDGDASVFTNDGGPLLTIDSCSNSMVRDIRLERKTNPTTVVRDWGSWTTSAVGTTGEGYMPGPNDTDGVWSGLTGAQQAETGCYIHLIGATDASGTYGKYVTVENLSSKFGSIIIENCEWVTVTGCRLWGERASAGCIWIKNYQARDNGAGLAKHIVIDGNICLFSAYNGICLDATDGAIVSNNLVGYCSETGIKLFQDSPSPAASSRGNFKTVVTGNSSIFCFEDGYNIASRFPIAATDTTYYHCVGNYAYGTNSAGFVIDGKHNFVSGNYAQGNNIDGIINVCDESVFQGNFLKDNNLGNGASNNDFTNNGTNNAIIGNYAYRTASRNGVGFFMGNTETLTMVGNVSKGTSCTISLDNAEVINSSGNYSNGTAIPSAPMELRSDSATDDSTNLTLSQASPTGNTITVEMKPRSTMTNPCSSIKATLANGVAGSETGELELRTRITGTDGVKAKVDFVGNFVPGVDNTYSCGKAALRWSEIFAGVGTINTSDANEKTVVDIEQKVLDAAAKIKINAYKFNDSIAKKGDDARIHYGVIAQDIKTAFEAEGLDPFKYGVLCYDEYEDENGVMTGKYGVRYDQLLAMKIAKLESGV